MIVVHLLHVLGLVAMEPPVSLSAKSLRDEVDNWRWHGVPFSLRSGKAMGASRQVIRLGFHQPPIRMFPVRRTGWPAEPYPRGSWRPESVTKLIAPYRWHSPES